MTCTHAAVSHSLHKGIAFVCRILYSTYVQNLYVYTSVMRSMCTCMYSTNIYFTSKTSYAIILSSRGIASYSV